jgi:hypothetical protein
MPLEKTDEVDSIGTDNETENIILSIIDDLNWNDEDTHIVLLQEKINNYLGFIESGEIKEVYPEAEGRNIELVIYAKYNLTERAIQFLTYASEIILNAGYTLLCYEWLPTEDGELEEWRKVL